MKESDLYHPIKKYLEKNKYKVNSEVLNCDIVAQKKEELIVIELKKNFNATLLIQAAERQKYADSVYVAITKPKTWGNDKKWNGMCHLLKRLELGLILVTFLKTKGRIDIAFHPAEHKMKKNSKKRKAILREIDNRSGDYNTGGVTGQKIVTAYRENAIFIACCLKKYGDLSPKKLKDLGAGDKTSTILLKDHYGWFERKSRGIYSLHENGDEALKKYERIAKFYFEELK